MVLTTYFQSPPKKAAPKRSLLELPSVKNAIYHGVQSLVSEQLVTTNLQEHAFVLSLHKWKSSTTCMLITSSLGVSPISSLVSGKLTVDAVKLSERISDQGPRSSLQHLGLHQMRLSAPTALSSAGCRSKRFAPPYSRFYLTCTELWWIICSLHHQQQDLSSKDSYHTAPLRSQAPCRHHPYLKRADGWYDLSSEPEEPHYSSWMRSRYIYAPLTQAVSLLLLLRA
jgi:hypothetical protein